MEIRNRRTRFLWVPMLASLLLVSLSVGAWAQESHLKSDRFKPQPNPTAGGEVTTPGIIVSPNEDHRIGPGDVIDVQVNLAPELSSTSRINADGTFLMPFIGRITARQKTSDELAEEIAGKLKGDYLKNPMVKVVIKQIYSHTYFIQGAIRRSGVYQVEGRPTLLELLTIGGGLGDNYGTTAFVIRRLKPRTPESAPPAETLKEQSTPETAAAAEVPETKDNGAGQAEAPAGQQASFEMLKANLTGLLKGNFQQNLVLEPGDIVNIPPSDVFFVAGEVRMPGSFPLKDGTTLRQAISLAQGTTPKAAGSRAVIYRENDKGQREEIKVDVDSVMRGKKDDLPILANDIVIIPNSAVKSAALPILNAFGTGVAWAVGGQLPGR
ncbi:MAG TPA: polysaccharide biosynthesis/export family protein [Blastocatellia bacterium]|nr:polysaccharide biosynthesis/export family protein [Blastocatellia bacterium]